MNQGKYLEEDLLDAEPSDFCIGVGRLSREALRGAEPALDVRRVKEKVEAGAHYVVTQMFFNNQHYFRYRRRSAARRGSRCRSSRG